MQRITRPRWRTKLIPVFPNISSSIPRISYPPSISSSSASTRSSSSNVNTSPSCYATEYSVSGFSNGSSQLSSMAQTPIMASTMNIVPQFTFSGPRRIPFGLANIKGIEMISDSHVCDKVTIIIIIINK